MANDSKMLNKSRDNADDEFYTLYEDVAAELPNYKEYLRGKRIICPCDWDESLDEALVYASEEYVAGNNLFSPGGSIKIIDADKSDEKVMADIRAVNCNFIKFLLSHAEAYGIESIAVSGYNPATGEGVKFEDIDYSKYDVVITNPPFSRFRDFVDVMFENGVDFLIIGPQNAIKYSNVFPHMQANELWLGYHYHLAGFTKPDGTVIPRQHNLARSCCWFTTLPVSYRNDEMTLTEEYSPERYPQIVNIDAIDVSKTKDIPFDYDGLMAVPITFMQKYCPEQFEIVGSSLKMAKPMAECAEPGTFSPGGPAPYTDRITDADKKKGYKYHRGFDRLIIRNKKAVKNDAEE